jgi:hypothetical protein
VPPEKAISHQSVLEGILDINNDLHVMKIGTTSTKQRLYTKNHTTKERFIIKLTEMHTKTNTQQVLCNSCLMNLSIPLKKFGSKDLCDKSISQDRKIALKK